MSDVPFVGIAGNIAVGKTTLTKMISERLGCAFFRICGRQSLSVRFLFGHEAVEFSFTDLFSFAPFSDSQGNVRRRRSRGARQDHL